MAEGPDERTLSDIRRWYQDNGVSYEKEDWGPRGENGESAGRQREKAERSGPDRVGGHDPTSEWWWERQRAPWRERDVDEAQWAWKLEDFFAPYISLLSRPKGNLLRQLINDGRTYAEIGEYNGVTRQAAYAAVSRAVQDLTKLIALDDPNFAWPDDGRKRDFAAERQSAQYVLEQYLRG